MPYRTAQTLPASADVKIFLQGQLILEPNSNGTQCDIGVNRCAPNHEFSMEVRQKLINPEDPDVIIARHLGTLLSPGVKMDLSPASIEGVRKFVPTIDFQRDDNPAREPLDFRWIVDLANNEFHNGALTINGTGTEPNIRIKDGIFYTALRTDPTKLKVTRTGGGLPDLVLHRIASVIGINIYLEPGRKFSLIWTPRGQGEKTLLLDKPNGASGIKHYEIWIKNDPPFVDPDEVSHAELKEYYKVIDKVGGSATGDFKRFELKFDEVVSGVVPNLGTPTIPCMPVGGGQ